MTAREKLLAIGRKQGPCLICGGPNHLARHRAWDAIDQMLRMDDLPLRRVAWNFGVPVAEVRLVREAYADARRRKIALPGRSEK